ncbi:MULTISPECIES: response regulator transcription factor [unclassified Corynebacterium]|uniref:response regulator transcription factor n=1 Tax=unclassified Corynebacterium TaxID=2624378 RepID=UPI001C455C59|nr:MULTISPECIES: response regulator transcription factor [unclassified Corynebacterium]MBV7281932.1 response regulator transcription factor [Corynebacterium sp. TAE3-ERU30]MBV7301565.1 response regulator transcription factor [Corynebacterium sp. TAE3-ERU2]
MSVTVMVVDDEPNIVELLDVSLKFQGFTVVTAYSGPAALEKLKTEQVDAFILDVMMPHMDGFELLSTIRAHGNDAPVLFLTAKDEVPDKIRGLTLGADDYVTKPFSLEEVVTRLRVILRRAQSSQPAEPGGRAGQRPVLRYADLELDDNTHEVRKAGEVVELSPTEYNVLHYLMDNAEIVLSKAQILDAVWNYDFGGDGNVVESYISYLRRKLDTTEPHLIHTVRGVGYILRVPKD